AKLNGRQFAQELGFQQTPPLTKIRISLRQRPYRVDCSKHHKDLVGLKWNSIERLARCMTQTLNLFYQKVGMTVLQAHCQKQLADGAEVLCLI
ncbi:MAG: hypothetical protein HN456_08890, partial [Rhodobacteraceae bacterium]|nr:hypothetical protein [Paracoccaceae bacterium]